MPPGIATASRSLTPKFAVLSSTRVLQCSHAEQAIARYLGWNFVTIDTSDFLADGMSNIASRLRYVFDKLKALEDTVVSLFVPL